MSIYNKTITVLNKLKAQDSSTKLDVYHKTVIPNCGWYRDVVTNVQGSTVSMSSVIKVFIPFTGKFLPYNEWKKPGMQDGKFTMSSNDTIILGDVEEEVTVKNIVQIKRLYEPDVCEVRHHRQCDKNDPNMLIEIFVEGV